MAIAFDQKPQEGVEADLKKSDSKGDKRSQLTSI
jgi:hypothetical protein